MIIYHHNKTGGREDLISAVAAHWFSMSDFWPEAANIVRPGGTVALWTCASLYCHPSAPNAASVQNALYQLERDILKPFELPGNKLSAILYDYLPLPCMVTRRREGNLDLVNTEDDCVKRTMREIRNVLCGTVDQKVGHSCLILLFKRCQE
ncbi:hypothetical protein RU639_001486 [Aspergillus parasiticus]